MKKITLLCIAFIAFAFSFQANAQCDYTLEMNDSWGDGWNGGTMDVLVNGTVVIDEATIVDGSQLLMSITVNDGDEITTMHSMDGSYPGEMSYRILDNLGTAVGTGNPTSDITTPIVVACQVVPDPPLCAGSPTPTDGGSNLGLGSTATLAWVADATGDAATSFEVFLGTTSGALTSLTTTTDETVNVTGLDYDTMYYWMIVPSNFGGATTGCAEWSFMTGSAPPAATNDTCDTGIGISCGSEVLGSTADAAATDTGGNTSADLWYVYSNPGVLEDVTFSTCGSAYDTNIRVYTDCPATTQIATNDDSCGVQSSVTVTNTGTETFYIMVEGFSTNTGDFILTTTCDVTIPAPGNDECATAEPLMFAVPVSGTTAGATENAAEEKATCDLFGNMADVWYTVEIVDGTSDLTLVTTLSGTSDQANIALYSACGGLQDDSLGCADTGEAAGETLTVTGLANGTYYVRVWSDGVAARNSQRVEGGFDIVADATLSAQDINANGLAFTYYPNPVNDNLALKAQKDIENVSVYNMLGQEVLRTAPNALNTEVNMSALQSGAYFVKVTIGNATETVRIIKN